MIRTSATADHSACVPEAAGCRIVHANLRVDAFLARRMPAGFTRSRITFATIAAVHGTVVVAGYASKYASTISKWNGIVDVACCDTPYRYGVVYGLQADGTVVNTGHGDVLTGIIAIEGGYNMVAIKEDGTLISQFPDNYGRNNFQKWDLIK